MYNVTLAQIRAFERTVRLGGVHATARHLGLTQPAVSQRIRELERTLGVKLFERHGRTLSLSPDGAALLLYADQLLNTANEMAVRLGTGDPLSGVLRLGVSKSFSLVCLPTLLDRLNQRYRALKTSIHTGDSNSISDLLNSRKLDLAVTSEYRIAEYIQREPIGANFHGWFANSAHEIGNGALGAEDLCAHHLIIPPAPTRDNTSVTEWFRRANCLPQRLSTCNDLFATIQLILGGVGIGFVPTRVMADYVAQGLVKQVDVQPIVPAYEVWACYQVEELGPGLRQVVDLIHQVVAEKRLYV